MPWCGWPDESRRCPPPPPPPPPPLPLPPAVMRRRRWNSSSAASARLIKYESSPSYDEYTGSASSGTERISRCSVWIGRGLDMMKQVDELFPSFLSWLSQSAVVLLHYLSRLFSSGAGAYSRQLSINSKQQNQQATSQAKSPTASLPGVGWPGMQLMFVMFAPREKTSLQN